MRRLFSIGVRQLPFKEFEFHGYKGKRRTVSFGWQYQFSGRGGLQKANDIPQFILPLRAVVAEFAQRVKILAEPCFAYHLTGPARHEWQHSIPSVTELRYSITFRSLA